MAHSCALIDVSCLSSDDPHPHAVHIGPSCSPPLTSHPMPYPMYVLTASDSCDLMDVSYLSSTWQTKLLMPYMYAPLAPPLFTGHPIMPSCLVALLVPVHPHLHLPCCETTEHQKGAGTEYACLVLVDLTVIMQPQMDKLPMVWPCVSVVNAQPLCTSM